MDYKSYLASSGWKLKAKEAKKAANHQCQLCASSQQLNTHHRSYENIGAEKPYDLIVLCQKCHGVFHEKLKLSVCRKATKKSQLEITTLLLRKSAKDLDISTVERLVLIQLSESHPVIMKSHATLAALVGCHTKTIQRSIRSLVAKDYIRIIANYNHEKLLPSVYKLNISALL